MLSVGNCVADNTFQEGLQDTASFFVDHGGDTFDTTTTGKTTNSGLGNTLNVVTQDLAMALGTALSKALATFAAYKGKTRQ
jgi:hypothetical protein